MSIDQDFALEMRAAMKQLGLSQSACVQELVGAGLEHFHQTTMSRILSGKQVVRLSEAVVIAQVLEMDLSQFFSSVPKPERSARDWLVQQHLRDALALLSPEQGAQS